MVELIHFVGFVKRIIWDSTLSQGCARIHKNEIQRAVKIEELFLEAVYL